MKTDPSTPIVPRRVFRAKPHALPRVLGPLKGSDELRRAICAPVPHVMPPFQTVLWRALRISFGYFLASVICSIPIGLSGDLRPAFLIMGLGIFQVCLDTLALCVGLTEAQVFGRRCTLRLAVLPQVPAFRVAIRPRRVVVTGTRRLPRPVMPEVLQQEPDHCEERVPAAA